MPKSRKCAVEDCGAEQEERMRGEKDTRDEKESTQGASLNLRDDSISSFFPVGFY